MTKSPVDATPPRRVLPVIVCAQFAGTSLWFAVNAVMPDLQRELGWPPETVGTLTSALQLGFIAGTLVFALLAVADRYPARRVFLWCSLAGAACTVGAWATVRDPTALALWRAATGFFLAGIYPVGMKIASQWFPRGLGSALGLLVGALVLGSASAHGLRGLGSALPWPSVMLGVAVLAAAGGCLLYALLPEPPATAARRATGLDLRALATLWTDRRVRASVFGYFGHMWELYTVWVLVPLILATRLEGAALSYAAFAVLGAARGQCARGGGATGGQRPVLSGRRGDDGRARLAVCRLAAVVGHHRGGRFTAVQRADGHQCPAPRRGQRADAGQQHRVRDFHRQHRVACTPGGARPPESPAALAGDRPDRRLVGPAQPQGLARGSEGRAGAALRARAATARIVDP
jgi:MFS family permease